MTVHYWEHVESVMRHTVYLATFAGHQHRKRNAINDRASYEEWRGGWWTGQMASVVLVTVSGRRRGGGCQMLFPRRHSQARRRHRLGTTAKYPQAKCKLAAATRYRSASARLSTSWYDVAAFSQFRHVHFITSLVMGGIKMCNRKLITK